MNLKKIHHFIDTIMLYFIYLILLFTLSIALWVLFLPDGQFRTPDLSTRNILLCILLLPLFVLACIDTWNRLPYIVKRRKSLAKKNLAKPSDKPLVYHRRDYLPLFQRSWPEMAYDLFQDRVSKPTRLDDLICRIQHMWGLNEQQIVAQADQKIVDYLCNRLDEMERSTPRYFFTSQDHYERIPLLADQPFLVYADMELGDEEIILKIRSNGCFKMSKDEYNRLGESLTKDLLLSVLAFVRKISSEKKYKLLELKYRNAGEKEGPIGKTRQESRPRHQFGFRDTPLIIVL
jgi:hypothetical protein